MALPSDLPEWASSGSAVVINPTSAKKAVGWVNTEKPPAGFLNWIAYTTYLWLVQLKALFLGTVTVKALQIDGTGGNAAGVAAGDIQASGNMAAGALVSGANVTATLVSTSARFRAVGGTVTSSNFSISAGWGNTATIFVAAGSTDTAGSVTITAGGAGIAADPRITLTFAGGTFPANGGVQIVNMVDTSESTNSGPIYGVVIKPSLTAPQWFMVGTPVTAKTYSFNWITISL